MADPRLPDRLAAEAGVRAGETRVYRAARKAFRALRKYVEAALDGSAMDPAVLDHNAPAWREQVEQAILPAVGDVFGKEWRRFISGPDVISSDPYVAAHLDAVDNRLVAVADDVFAHVTADLNEGREQGESIPQLATRIDATLADTGSVNWPGRATTIARTETISAYNDARLEAAQAYVDLFGFDPAEVEKEWLATRDSRTRDSHRAADGQRVPLGDRFTLNGASGAAYAMAPGDPTLPPDESINCRCTLLVHYPDDLTASGQLLTFEYNPDQLRVPKGNGKLSGRWMPTPNGVLDELGDLADGLTIDPDNLDDLSGQLRTRAGETDDEGAASELRRGADAVDAFSAVDWSKRRVTPGEMTVYDVPGNVDFGGTTRSKPGMHPLTKQDYVDYYNREGKRIPPKWTDVLIADAPYDPETHDHRQQVEGLDRLGRHQSQYAAGWDDYKAAVKWDRASHLIGDAPALRTKVEQDYAHDPAAGALALQMVMGIRTGSTTTEPTEKGHTAIGASTMPASAVHLNDDGSVSFDYIGKSNQRAQLTSSDPLVRNVIEHYLAGKSGDDRLFDTNETKVRGYFDGIQKDLGIETKYTPKDFRTLHGTAIAQRMVSDIGRPAKDQKEYDRYRKRIADAVSDFLNNTPTVALGSYITPSVFDRLRPAGIAAAGGTQPVQLYPFDATEIDAEWAGVARPPTDLTAYGPIDSAETYEDLAQDDEMTATDPTMFTDPLYAPGDDDVPDDTLTAAADDIDPADLPVVIVGLPAADDPVRGYGDEDKHVTLAYLGGGKGEAPVADLDAIKTAVGQVANASAPFPGRVTGLDRLGDDDPAAFVALLDDQDTEAGPAQMRAALLANQTIGGQHDAVDQKYPTYTPHVTLDYADDVPGSEELTGSSIDFDRLAVWAGDDHTEYPLGDDMPDTTTDDVPQDVIDELDQLSAEPIPWHGVLAPEGVMSGDRRKFSPGSLRTRDLPVPLAWQKSTSMGHDGAVVVGRIDTIDRDANGLMRASGVFDVSPEAEEAVRQLAEQMIRGVSVDVDDATFEYEKDDGTPLTGDEPIEELMDMPEPVMVVSDGRICGATLCAIPAFQEAYVALGPWEDADADSPDLTAPLDDDAEAGDTFTVGELADADAAPADDSSEYQAGDYVSWTGPDGDSLQGQIVSVADDTANVSIFTDDADSGETVEVAVADLSPWAGPATEDADDDAPLFGLSYAGTPGVMPRKLKEYWTHGEGAAKIGWGTGGDFNRCRANLAKYVGPEMLSGLCANLHKAATGVWPGQEATLDAGETGGTALSMAEADCECDALVASGVPGQAFADPQLDEPTPLTVTEDGRVFGHLATWGTCHVGVAGSCITPPESASGYAYFTTGAVVTDTGVQPVGHITMGTGHADPKLGSAPAAAHYDNTGAVVADIAAGEDAYGIWIAGQLRPGVSDEQRHALAAGALSGDWRRIRGGLELVAALAVNVPGFPIPRVKNSMADGRQLALVASGIVARTPVPATGSAEPLSRVIRREMRAADRRKVRAERLAASIGRDRRTRVLTASAVIHRNEE